MLNNIKALRRGDLDSVDPKTLYPILRWLSGSKTELEWCAEVNKTFWWVPPEIAKGLIYLGLRDNNPFIKYPKATKKESDKVFDLKKSLVMQYYGWSSQEFSRNASILSNINFEVIADSLGIENRDRKVLGLTVTKAKPKKKTPPKGKTLFDF